MKRKASEILFFMQGIVIFFLIGFLIFINGASAALCMDMCDCNCACPDNYRSVMHL